MPIPLRGRIPTRPALALVALVCSPLLTRAADPAGQQIYAKQCARCHGPAGEGTKKATQPLRGDKPLAALTKVVRETMPENDPGSLSEKDAAAVAAFMHEAFYSVDAQTRNKPPRVELSRLTVGQYRNSVADVIAGFRPTVKPDDRRGLRAEYFNARNTNPKARLIDRTDPEVAFDFGTTGPGEKFDPHQFSIRWEGSVLAPETGVYEFAVKCDHAVRLWVNDTRKPLIDAWVKSGSDTEFKGTIFLLAGRAYPIRMEFSKAKQGVDDSKKNPNPPPKKAMVALEWKPPHGALTVIPARHLSPGKAVEVFAVATKFPPDDRSLGWERGNVVSKEWDAATTDAAIETAGYVLANLRELSGAGDADKDRAAKLKAFARTFAERAFRRPLTPEQAAVYIDRQFAVIAEPEEAVRRVVLLVLKSPRFLYHGLGGSDAYAVAERLSFALWDAPPDGELLKAAAAGKLTTSDDVAKQAERMLADPRAKAKLRAFLLTWLKVDQVPDMAKDPKKFTGFDEAVAADLRTSLELFLDDVVWSEKSDFRQFLLGEDVYLNAKLAKFYGVELPAEAKGFEKMKLNPGKRAGVLTHPYMMAAFSYTAESSPIHRGVFVARGVLGITLRPPNEAFTPLAADLHPNLTTRERVLLQTKPAACAGCHGLINPLGFTLEHFDAVGRYRDTDRGKPVDDTGSYLTRDGGLAKFGGVRDLATFLAGSGEVHAAFAEQLFHHLAKQPVRAYGMTKPTELRDSFSRNGYSVCKLAIEVAVIAALPSPNK